MIVWNKTLREPVHNIDSCFINSNVQEYYWCMEIGNPPIHNTTGGFIHAPSYLMASPRRPRDNTRARHLPLGHSYASWPHYIIKLRARAECALRSIHCCRVIGVCTLRVHRDVWIIRDGYWKVHGPEISAAVRYFGEKCENSSVWYWKRIHRYRWNNYKVYKFCGINLCGKRCFFIVSIVLNQCFDSTRFAFVGGNFERCADCYAVSFRVWHFDLCYFFFFRQKTKQRCDGKINLTNKLKFTRWN